MKKIGFLILFGCLSLLAPRPGAACEPVRDYWFQEVIEFAQVELPEGMCLYGPGTPVPQPPPQGIWLSAVEATQSARAAIILSNALDEPAFVMSRQYRDVLVMETPDPNYPARLRMAHESASYMAVAGTRQTVVLAIEALLDLDPTLQDANILDFSPPDPGAPVPPSQSSELLLVYMEQVIVVPFTIRYHLNGQFDNGGCTEWWESANATSASYGETTRQAASAGQDRLEETLAFALVGLGVTGVVFWLLLSLLRGPRK